MSGAAPLALIVGYLDELLRTREVPDAPNAVNGLQVENTGSVHHIVAAVDASIATVRGAAAAGRSSLLLVHHGLFWDGNVPITGRRYAKVRALIDADVALYSTHLPLDLHEEVGNNHVLARRLGVTVDGPFGEYRGTKIGVWGSLDMDRDALVRQLDAELRTEARLIPGGPERVRRVGIVSGAAGDRVAEARAAGLDTLITGEGPHHTYFDATELGVNLIYAGHYATETLGVRTLAEHISERFGVPWEFHDHPTGL